MGLPTHRKYPFFNVWQCEGARISLTSFENRLRWNILLDKCFQAENTCFPAHVVSDMNQLSGAFSANLP
jgi:hypothetical protein